MSRPIAPCAVDPTRLCTCPALAAPFGATPCDNCAERRRHARGCATKPYPGGREPGPCNCRPLADATPCPRSVAHLAQRSDAPQMSVDLSGYGLTAATESENSTVEIVTTDGQRPVGTDTDMALELGELRSAVSVYEGGEPTPGTEALAHVAIALEWVNQRSASPEAGSVLPPSPRLTHGDVVELVKALEGKLAEGPESPELLVKNIRVLKDLDQLLVGAENERVSALCSLDLRVMMLKEAEAEVKRLRIEREATGRRERDYARKLGAAEAALERLCRDLDLCRALLPASDDDDKGSSHG